MWRLGSARAEVLQVTSPSIASLSLSPRPFPSFLRTSSPSRLTSASATPQLMGERLRRVFGDAALWPATRPNQLQLTRMGHAQQIANHYDKRDKWKEGIASVAWSELPCEEDLRGEPWTLTMERNNPKKARAAAARRAPRAPRHTCARDDITMTSRSGTPGGPGAASVAKLRHLSDARTRTL